MISEMLQLKLAADVFYKNQRNKSTPGPSLIHFHKQASHLPSWPLKNGPPSTAFVTVQFVLKYLCSLVYKSVLTHSAVHPSPFPGKRIRESQSDLSGLCSYLQVICNHIFSMQPLRNNSKLQGWWWKSFGDSISAFIISNHRRGLICCLF